jgi:enediyne biosynthesis protein E4
MTRQARRGRAAAVLAAAGAGLWVALAGAQGMGTVKRPARTIPAIQTSLPPITVDYRDVAEDAGLTAPTISGGAERKRYLLETTGSGVAILDVDNDGLQDVFVVSATVLDGKSDATSHLYRNRGSLRFEDVTLRAGLTRTGWGQGVCAGDYDNDGYRDLFVTYYGQSVLYRNERSGAFRDVTVASGLQAAGTRWETGCSFFDYDLDGRLDLVVTSYLEFDRAKIPEPGAGGYCQWKGLPVMCGPRGLPFSRHRLLHNEGGGRFTDVSKSSGIGATTGCYGFTVSALDADSDGYPDLYVACDSTPSLLYRNRRNGTFEEVGLLSGVALNEDGQEQGGMGVAIADYDEDGDEDIVKTNFSDDIPNVYHNTGRGLFEDRVLQSGLGGYMQFVGWGVHLLDVDHDGRRDLLMINGHVYPEAEKTGVGYRQPRLLYWHVGDGRFKDISEHAGPAVGAAFSSRGSAAGDLDNDGSLEVVVNNLGARPSLLKNHGPRQHWLLVRLVGTSANRDAVGARAVVWVGDRRVSGEVQTGSSFVSQNDSRVHVGLGPATRYDRIEVSWPGGARETFHGGAADRLVTLEQGTGSSLPR